MTSLPPLSVLFVFIAVQSIHSFFHVAQLLAQEAAEAVLDEIDLRDIHAELAGDFGRLPLVLEDLLPGGAFLPIAEPLEEAEVGGVVEGDLRRHGLTARAPDRGRPGSRRSHRARRGPSRCGRSSASRPGLRWPRSRRGGHPT